MGPANPDFGCAGPMLRIVAKTMEESMFTPPPDVAAGNSLQRIVAALADGIQKENWLSEEAKNHVLRNLAKLKETKVNILITGATGSGKSSTINALFDTERAKVGQGADPETMHVAKYELGNIVLFDSPGLGDGKEADQRHAKAITKMLRKRDRNGEALIDLVLVILDGGLKIWVRRLS